MRRVHTIVGNDIYRAMAQGISMKHKGHALSEAAEAAMASKLRKEVIGYIGKNPEILAHTPEFSTWAARLHIGNRPPKELATQYFKAYELTHSNPNASGHRGGEFELRILTSFKGVGPVDVYQAPSQRYMHTVDGFQSAQKHPGHIALLTNGVHYDVLIPDFYSAHSPLSVTPVTSTISPGVQRYDHSIDDMHHEYRARLRRNALLASISRMHPGISANMVDGLSHSDLENLRHYIYTRHPHLDPREERQHAEDLRVANMLAYKKYTFHSPGSHRSVRKHRPRARMRL